MQGNYLTVYIRKLFTLDSPTPLQLSIDYDDGFVAYVNGAEVCRRNVSANPPTHQSPADGNHEAGTPVECAVAADVLISGLNVVAIQGHNRNLASSDFSLIPTLQLPFEPVLINEGAVWAYLDNGSDLGTAWRNIGFNDSGWSRGNAELGYGDGDEMTPINSGPADNKHITYYFRHAFQVIDRSHYRMLTLGLRRDDGAVVYLNGQEVFRSNLPSGSIHSNTLASEVVGEQDESNFFTADIDPTALQDGTNLLAVEVHQAGPSSSDVSFDLKLVGSSAYILVGAGDIADGLNRAEDTAQLLDDIPGLVFALGDTAYECGHLDPEFKNYYDPTWGRHKARSRPAPGNHEYGFGSDCTPDADASGYFGYFGEVAGPPQLGYYNYDVGSWHVIVLNSCLETPENCTDENAGIGETQSNWLNTELNDHRNTACTLVYMRHPLFSSGHHGEVLKNNAKLKQVWEQLYTGGVDVILSGHDHIYERFAPQKSDGTVDAAHGIRAFVVGTGGKALTSQVTRCSNSEVLLDAKSAPHKENNFGVLKLALSEGSYEWSFISTINQESLDSDTGLCHGRP